MRLKITIDLAKINEEVVQKYVKWTKDGKGYLNLFVGSLKERDCFGNHLFVEVEGYGTDNRPKKPLYIGSGRSCRTRFFPKGDAHLKKNQPRKTRKTYPDR